jgi:hypothetical protein
MSPLIFSLSCSSASRAVTVAGGDPRSQIEAERERKAAVLEPDEPTKAEQVLTRIKDEKILERIQAGYNGLRGKLGGLATGGGSRSVPSMRARIWPAASCICARPR